MGDDQDLVKKPDFSNVPNMRQGDDGNAYPQDLKPGQQAGTPLAEAFFNPLLRAFYSLISVVNQVGKNLQGYLPLSGGKMGGDLEVQSSNFSNRKLAVNTEMADQRYLKLSGGATNGDITLLGTGVFGETKFGGQATSQILGQPQYCSLQLQNVGGKPTVVLVFFDGNGGFRTWNFDPASGQVSDPVGNIMLTPAQARQLFLPLAGGTVTGELFIQTGLGDESKPQYGGVVKSTVNGLKQWAGLQMQGMIDNLYPVVTFFDGAGGWKTWKFDTTRSDIIDPAGRKLANAADLALKLDASAGIVSFQTEFDDRVDKIGINKSGVPWMNNAETDSYSFLATQDWARKSFLQLPLGSPPLKIQAFRVSSGGGNGSPRISFPEAFSQTLSVSAIVNQTPNSGTVSRTVNILPNNNSNDMRLDNWGFNCQIFYALGSGGAGTTGDPWTMLVTAIGVA